MNCAISVGLSDGDAESIHFLMCFEGEDDVEVIVEIEHGLCEL